MAGIGRKHESEVGCKLFRDATIVDLTADEDEYVSDDEDFEETNENSYD